MWGLLCLENKGEEAPPHIKNWGSQIFMLGTPSILYVGLFYVPFPPPILWHFLEENCYQYWSLPVLRPSASAPAVAKKFEPWSHKPPLLNGRFGNCNIGGCFANPSPTFRQPFANPSPTLRQPFLPTPLQPPLSVNPKHPFRDTGSLIPLSMLVSPKKRGSTKKVHFLSFFCSFLRLFGPKKALLPCFGTFLPTFFSSKLRFFEPPNALFSTKKAWVEMTPKKAQETKRAQKGGSGL